MLSRGERVKNVVEKLKLVTQGWSKTVGKSIFAKRSHLEKQRIMLRCFWYVLEIKTPLKLASDLCKRRENFSALRANPNKINLLSCRIQPCEPPTIAALLWLKIRHSQTFSLPNVQESCYLHSRNCWVWWSTIYLFCCTVFLVVRFMLRFDSNGIGKKRKIWIVGKYILQNNLPKTKKTVGK